MSGSKCRWAPLIACGMLSTTPLHLQGHQRATPTYGLWAPVGWAWRGSVRMGSAPEQRTAGGQLPPFRLGLPMEVRGLVVACTRPSGFFAYMAAQRFGTQFWLGIPLALAAVWAMHQSISVDGVYGRDRQRIPVWILAASHCCPEPAVELCGHDILASKLLAPDTPAPRCALLVAIWRRPGSGLYLMMGFGIASIHFVIFGLSTYSHFAQIGRHSQPILTADATRLHPDDQCCEPADVGARSLNRNSRAPSTQPINLWSDAVG